MAVTRPISHLTIARHLRIGCAKAVDSAPVGQNVRVRKLLIGVLATATAVVVGAVGADFGAAIYAEYRLARSVRTAAEPGLGPVGGDPRLSVHPAGGRPALRRGGDQGQWRRSPGRRQGLAGGHPAFDRSGRHVVAGQPGCQAAGRQGRRAASSSTPRTSAGSWASPTCWSRRRRGKPTTPPAAPPNRASRAIAGLVFTGTPKKAGFDEKVSIAVDLSIAGPDQTTLVLTATGVLTGAGTADQAVPDDKKAAVLGCVHHQPARPEAAVRARAHRRGGARLRHHHRGHRRGSNHRPR